MGRPAHQPSVESRAIVWEMTAFGVPQERVARAMSISADTLAKHYRDEPDAATDEAVTQVGKNLFSKALGDGRERRLDRPDRGLAHHEEIEKGF